MLTEFYSVLKSVKITPLNQLLSTLLYGSLVNMLDFVL
jgi:hypothetical protein